MSLGPIVYVYAERKISAFMQDRLGPMRVGPYGVLQTIADTIKLLFKEAIFPRGVDRKLFVIAPLLVNVGAFLPFVVIPWGARLQPADLNVGIFYVSAISAISTVGPDHGGLGLEQQVRALRRDALGGADRLLRDPGAADHPGAGDDRRQPVAAGPGARAAGRARRAGSCSATSR